MNLKIAFSDFDGTLTLDNRELTKTFFDVIEHLKIHGQELVIVSGRSISWGHFLLTHFSNLKGVIMEGGGVILTRNKRNDIDEHLLIDQGEVQTLANVTEELQRVFPKCPLSADSFGRKTDRAIEFEFMQDEEIAQVLQFFKTKKVNYSKSNVHINFWCGDVSKYNGVMAYLEKIRPDVDKSEALFFGDAPNDQSMFQSFENSVGVSNIRHCLSRLEHKPRIILEGVENEGPNGVLNYLKKMNALN
ncbi:MAG: Cof-type HAD-IIB family hydrolase [Bacteriovoracaceae bacterium]|nr:Cof-type HAD-IIB family hydrolase [Bacteriovoracaceae bacterium]